jgi:hypothetical protein
MIRYFLNGAECNPVNRDEIEYVFNFNDRKVRELEMSVSSLEFALQDFTAIQTWRATNGDYLGMPLSIEYSSGLVVNYYLDFSDSLVVTNRSISCKVIRYQATDNFFDNAEGLSFGAMSWQSSDFIYVDYVVIPENQFSYFMSLALATFALAQELAKSIQSIQEGISDVVKAATPVGIPPGPDWGAIIVAVIKLAARIAYAIFIAVALIKVVTELLNLIFPKVRQFKATKLKKLIEKGCQHLGYTLQSTLLNELKDVAVCPVPLRTKNPSIFVELFAPMSLAYTLGYPSVRDSIQTLGQALAAVETLGNAKTRVANGVVTIEQEMFYEQNAAVNVPVAFNMQEQLNNANGINSDEQYKRIVALYQVDGSDVNTFDDTKGTLYENSAEIVTSTGVNYELIRGILTVNIPFARGTRKASLTFVEKAAAFLAEAVDSFTGGNLSGLIESRKNVMQISSQYFNTTKLLVMGSSGSKLASDQNKIIGCDKIINKYYYSKFLTNNQKDTFDPMKMAATETETFAILANNFVNLDDGRVAEVTDLRWNGKLNLANLTFRVRKAAINEQITVINNGY